MTRKSVLIAVIIGLTGCATVQTRTPETYQKNSFYSGTQQDGRCFFDAWMCALDLPLSLVGDTLMLPFDGWYYLQTPAVKPEKEKQ
ncbi:YceK/YidQ family lipoprotein [Erwinia sp. E602]|uniref:YceK/YidQ family lipoprotein n=1 Tax=Erwinia sp. E602 TaxID=2675378 RepID=UPI001BA4F4E4|nr:YceK/YidQ family lipoprotein [Erwinia sp. E602]